MNIICLLSSRTRAGFGANIYENDTLLVESPSIFPSQGTKTMIEESGWADTNDTSGEAMRAEQKQASIKWTNSLPVYFVKSSFRGF